MIIRCNQFLNRLLLPTLYARVPYLSRIGAGRHFLDNQSTVSSSMNARRITDLLISDFERYASDPTGRAAEKSCCYDCEA